MDHGGGVEGPYAGSLGIIAPLGISSTSSDVYNMTVNVLVRINHDLPVSVSVSREL